METVAIWGDIATWVTSIATIALFIIGFIQIRNERQARIKREKEEVAIKKRDQAEHISSWIVRQTHDEQGSWMWVAVLNHLLSPSIM